MSWGHPRAHLFLFLRDHCPLLSTVLKTIVSYISSSFCLFQAKQKSALCCFLNLMWMSKWFWVFLLKKVQALMGIRKKVDLRPRGWKQGTGSHQTLLLSLWIFSKDSLGKRFQETLYSRIISRFIFMIQNLQQWKKKNNYSLRLPGPCYTNTKLT